MALAEKLSFCSRFRHLLSIILRSYKSLPDLLVVLKATVRVLVQSVSRSGRVSI